ncbi:MAG: response regulator transcription factor [Deltaproteobacteria bacterium]|nr:response regulator transcription factor [Deltaproteobacteria bacterium]
MDGSLERRTPTEVLGCFRAVTREAPALVLLELPASSEIEAVFALHATAILPRNASDASLLRFFTDCRLRRTPEERLASSLRALRRRYQLTQAEEQIVSRALWGASREAIAETRGTSSTTVKKQIRVLLAKTPYQHLHHLAQDLLLEALFGGAAAARRNAAPPGPPRMVP